MDRDALLLRYFKNADLRTVGKALGISDDAAQKRVSRAVERVREFFAKRGVTIGATGVVIAISANAVQAAPVGLAMNIATTAALAGTATTTFSTVTASATKVATMTMLQKTLVTASLTILAGAGIFEAHQSSQLREQVKVLQQQQVPVSEQIQQLQNERDESLRQLASMRAQSAESSNNSTELLRLRNEVAQLRRQQAEQKTSASTTQRPPPGVKVVAKNSDARYLRKDELANVGYATPLTALQTITWAMMNASYDDVLKALSPEIRESEFEKPGESRAF